MMYSPLKKIAAAILLSMTILPSVYAADIARTLRTNSADNDSPDNYLEISLGVGGFTGSSFTHEDGQAFGGGWGLRGSYNYQGFFIDLNGETSEHIVLGYNAYNHDNWSFDLVLGETNNGLSERTDPRFQGISQRESSTMLGGRLTGYFGENIVQFSIKHDVSGNSKASTASAMIGRNWQYRNWNFHGLAGLGFDDAKAMDYYYGVSEQEAANSIFSPYQGKAKVNFFSSVGVTYPISESWIYRATVGMGTDFGSNKSPLFLKKRNFRVGFGTNISYVF